MATPVIGQSLHGENNWNCNETFYFLSLVAPNKIKSSCATKSTFIEYPPHLDSWFLTKSAGFSCFWSHDISLKSAHPPADSEFHKDTHRLMCHRHCRQRWTVTLYPRSPESQRGHQMPRLHVLHEWPRRRTIDSLWRFGILKWRFGRVWSDGRLTAWSSVLKGKWESSLCGLGQSVCFKIHIFKKTRCRDLQWSETSTNVKPRWLSKTFWFSSSTAWLCPIRSNTQWGHVNHTN